jgi:hypothetical protein
MGGIDLNGIFDATFIGCRRTLQGTKRRSREPTPATRNRT